jgi:DNA mismatch endonuclease, patch repair protein
MCLPGTPETMDNLTKEQRYRSMANNRNKNTGPELQLCRLLKQEGLRFRVHDRRLPGTPDIVFHSVRTVVLVHGDFWHGWRFNTWRHTLSEQWAAKIERNRRRDRCNARKLRRQGWQILRVWEHELQKDARSCVVKVVAVLSQSGRLLANSPSAQIAIEPSVQRRGNNEQTGRIGPV